MYTGNRSGAIPYSSSCAASGHNSTCQMAFCLSCSCTRRNVMYVHASAVIQMFRMCVEASGLSSLQSTVSATESKLL